MFRTRRDRVWRRKQHAAAPGRYYGDGGTIHPNTDLDVEVHDGQVVAVWFRCQMLPYRQRNVSSERAQEMRRLDDLPTPLPALTGVELLDHDTDGHLG